MKKNRPYRPNKWTKKILKGKSLDSNLSLEEAFDRLRKVLVEKKYPKYKSSKDPYDGMKTSRSVRTVRG